MDMARQHLLILCTLFVSVSRLHASDYGAVIRADSPVAWWRFDEVDQDSAAEEQQLSLVGRYLDGSTNRRGVSGLAARFERTSRRARVEIPLDTTADAAIDGLFNASFTLEFWLLDDAAAPDNATNYSLFYKADQSAFIHNSLWLYRARQDGRYHFRIQSGKDSSAAIITIPNPAGPKARGDQKWHHLAITVAREKNPIVARAFLDATLVAEVRIDNVQFDNSGPLVIGNNHHRGSPWHGGIDELAVYDRALSDKDIRRHFEAGQESLKSPSAASDTLAVREEFFELHIRPFLIEKCSDCHAGDAESESSFSVMSRKTLLAGGDFGPAVVPGRAEDSLLMHAVKRTHKELKMPPDSPLSRQEIAALERWINAGAVWPRSKNTELAAVPTRQQDAPTQAAILTHWSFQPRRKSIPPEATASRWNRTTIDQFVEAARRKAHVTAVDPADRATLIRRATFDLIGLPPTPDEVDNFVNDPRDDTAAFSDVVDRLLASRHYGERQGRLWLDVARYADTQGDVGDIPIPKAYLYRNWVIDALKADVPYDEFLRQQIAGDILARDAANADDARELIIATGFIALSRRFGNTKKDDLHLTIEDTLDTIGRGLLGLTLRCARCHDHKFDPIRQTDYYGLYGIFESTTYPWMGMSNEKSPSALSPARPDPETMRKAKDHWNLITRYEYQINNHFRPWLKPTLDEFRGVTKRIASLDGQTPDSADLQKLEERREELLSRHKGRFRELMLHGLNWIKAEKKQLAENPGIEFLFAVSEGRPHDAKLHRRGNVRTLGDVVPRHAPPLMDGNGTLDIGNGSGRLELARWITRPDHPLTTRVIVNRIWQQHFGRGLVETADNFGRQGVTPSHPELLDWLTEQFVTDGWSLKKLHRRIMLTETYRLSSAESPEALAANPGNQWLWRQAPRRLDAEQIRDAMLMVSGDLDRSQGGPHPFKPWHVVRYSLNRPFHEEYPTNRRSVYLMTQRLFRNSFLGLFDGPDTNSSTSRRGSANVPAQALYLMNSSFVQQQSESLARRLQASYADDEQRVLELCRIALGRRPHTAETELFLQFLRDYGTDEPTKDRSVPRKGLIALSRAVITSNEFFFVE